MTIREPVAVFGATDHTGRFAAELAARGTPLMLIRRDNSRLAECHPKSTTRVATTDDAATIDAAPLGAEVFGLDAALKDYIQAISNARGDSRGV